MTVRAIPASPARLGIDDVLRRRHGENFSVAAAWIPRRERQLLLAVYAYARFVDEIGDGGAADALDRLDAVAADVRDRPSQPARVPELVGPLELLLRAGAPPGPMLDLIAANVADQHVHSYATFACLLGYCRLSADPVGRLVLWVMGVDDPVAERRSDAVCSGLQVVEHLQDVGEDARRGRVYLPADDLAAAGVAEAELVRPAATPALRRVVALEAARAERMLRLGSRLAGMLRGWRRAAVAGYVGGGLAAIAALEAAGWDVLGGTPRAGRGSRAWTTARIALRGSAR
jgi:squalene synthase HpnC